MVGVPRTFLGWISWEPGDGGEGDNPVEPWWWRDVPGAGGGGEAGNAPWAEAGTVGIRESPLGEEVR